jgi:hypothetical protein
MLMMGQVLPNPQCLPSPRGLSTPWKLSRRTSWLIDGDTGLHSGGNRFPEGVSANPTSPPLIGIHAPFEEVADARNLVVRRC